MSGKEYTAKTIEEAIETALNEMMLTRDDIEYEVISQPSKGFLGIGSKQAVVRVTKKEAIPILEKIEKIEKELKEEQYSPEIHKDAASEAALDPVPKCDPVKKTPFREMEPKKKKYEIDAEERASVQNKVERKELSRTEVEAAGRKFLDKIFQEMHLDVTIEVKEKDGYLVFDLKGEHLGILIGRRGDTLDALQFLLNLVINDKNSSKVKGIIDIENYRAKREETLIHLSHKLALKARKSGQKVILEPMNPQERRIIHMALQDDRRVSTYSEGEEPYRKVVIVPEKTK